MFFLSNFCFVCLSTSNNLKLVLIESSEGILVQKKLKYCIPEIVENDSQIPKYICSDCSSKLECFYKFKQTYLRNKTYLKSYFQTLTSTGESCKQLSVTLTDIKYQNKPQAVSSDQTLAIVGSDDVLRTGEKEDNGTCIQEAVSKSEIQCAHVLDIDLHSLNVEENNIIVKEEFLTSEYNFDNGFVKTENWDLIPSDSDISVPSIEDLSYFNSNSENNSINPKENKQQAVRSDQTLAIVGSDVLRTGEKEDNGTCLLEAASKSEIQCSQVLDIDLHSLNVEENNICVKEEFLTSEYNFNNGIVESEHWDLIPSDSDISVPSIEDLSYSNCSSENNSTNPKENKVTRKKKIKKNKILQCAICKKEFMYKSLLIRHIICHTGIKNYECAKCQKRFHTKIQLIRHVKSHTSNKLFECSVCEKKFKHKSYLIHHENSHKGINNFECTICKKKITHKTYLIQHIKNHTSTKKYECTVCKKKFMQKCNLKTHERIHAGIKTYECLVCNKKFSQKTNMIRHENIHKDIENK